MRERDGGRVSSEDATFFAGKEGFPLRLLHRTIVSVTLSKLLVSHKEV